MSYLDRLPTEILDKIYMISVHENYVSLMAEYKRNIFAFETLDGPVKSGYYNKIKGANIFYEHRVSAPLNSNRKNILWVNVIQIDKKSHVDWSCEKRYKY